MSDLARQNTNEYRARYYAEARTLLKSLVVLEWVDSAEAEQSPIFTLSTSRLLGSARRRESRWMSR